MAGPKRGRKKAIMKKDDHGEEPNGSTLEVSSTKGEAFPPVLTTAVKLVLNKFTLPEAVYFGSVCRTWRDASHWYFPVVPQAPWRWVITKKSRSKERYLVSVKQGYPSNVKIRLPHAVSAMTRCFGSSQGWLLLRDLKGSFLWNPMSNQLIALPKLKLLDGGFRLSRVGKYLTFLYMHLVPTVSGCIVIVRDVDEHLLIWRPGDSNWTLIGGSFNSANRILQIAATLDGGVSFLALARWGTMFVIDVVSQEITLVEHSRWAEEDESRVRNSEDDVFNLFVRVAMPVTCDSDAYLVYYRISGGQERKLEYLRVKRLNQSAMEWSEVHVLGDHSLFIGTSGSVIVASAEETGCRPNCIYFALEDNGWKVLDMGQPDYSFLNVTPSRFTEGVWITPTLQ